MVWVYMLKCRDNSYYTGWTNALEKRIKMHARGKGSRYTRSRLPIRLVYCEQLTNKNEALRREYFIKQLSRIHKHQLINKDTAG